MYNQNLEIVQTFGQENVILPFFFSPEIDFFFVSNKYFIFNETLIHEDDDDNYNRVTIINRSNCLVETSFVIYEDFSQMKLYLDKYLITFDKEICLLKCYNFKGDFLHKMTLDKKFEGSKFCVINKELCFVLDNDIFFIF